LFFMLSSNYYWDLQALFISSLLLQLILYIFQIKQVKSCFINIWAFMNFNTHVLELQFFDWYGNVKLLKSKLSF
jgi:hypothetical protein